MPRARNLLITFSMSFMPAFMLLMCMSVEMVSGTHRSLKAGTAVRKTKLPPPWPTSKTIPFFCAAKIAGL